jgi:hypothetical protein
VVNEARPHSATTRASAGPPDGRNLARPGANGLFHETDGSVSRPENRFAFRFEWQKSATGREFLFWEVL